MKRILRLRNSIGLRQVLRRGSEDVFLFSVKDPEAFIEKRCKIIYIILRTCCGAKLLSIVVKQYIIWLCIRIERRRLQIAPFITNSYNRFAAERRCCLLLFG